MPPYPLIKPYDHGMLDTSDGNLVYWEECGDPDGKPPRRPRRPRPPEVRLCST
jgi:hypothetical protein